MSFSRLSYDDCEYAKTLQESTGPFKYISNPVMFEASDQCNMVYPGFNSANTFNQGIRPESVDIESEIQDRTRAASKCPTKRYNPRVNCKTCESCNQGLPCSCLHCTSKNPHNLSDCQNEIVPIQTRSFNACSDLNGIFVNRFQPLCEDPQGLDKIHSNDFIGMDTRNVTKDQAAASPVGGVTYSHVDGFAKELQPSPVSRFSNTQRNDQLSNETLSAAQRNKQLNDQMRK